MKVVPRVRVPSSPPFSGIIMTITLGPYKTCYAKGMDAISLLLVSHLNNGSKGVYDSDSYLEEFWFLAKLHGVKRMEFIKEDGTKKVWTQDL